jgi:phosphomannomutase
MPKLDPTILKKYDIRGVVNETLKYKDAYYIGRAFATQVGKGKTVVVGMDGRLSSPEMKNELISGLTSSGCNVADIGICPTPELYYTVYNYNYDGGIMITASHNPKEYNGFKMMIGKKSFYGRDILNLGELVESEEFAEGSGEVHNIDVKAEYIDRITKDIKTKGNLKIAWDCGNGSAAVVMRQLKDKIDAEHITLYDDLDGNFPNHHPDPLVLENLKDLEKTVIENNCDFGVAFDGDADRIGIIDDKGRPIFGDQLLVLFAKDVLEKHPGATIITEVKVSKSVVEEIEKMGGNLIIWKAGHSLIKSKMVKEDAKLAGELSGHMFFADQYYGYDDALYSAGRLISIVSKMEGNLSDWLDSLPQTVSTPEIRVPCADDKKKEVVEKIADMLREEGKDFLDIDGVRVNKGNGWWLIRHSGTQPSLTIRAESDNTRDLESYKDEMVKYLNSVGYEIDKL